MVFGTAVFMVNTGIITPMAWMMLWPILVIGLGAWLVIKHAAYPGGCKGMCGAGKENTCGCGGAAGCCGKGEEKSHTCSGEGCSTCK